MVARPDSAGVPAHRARSSGGWLLIVVALYLHAFLSLRRSIKTASGGQVLLAERRNTCSCCRVSAGTVPAKKKGEQSSPFNEETERVLRMSDSLRSFRPLLLSRSRGLIL